MNLAVFQSPDTPTVFASSSTFSSASRLTLSIVARASSSMPSSSFFPSLLLSGAACERCMTILSDGLAGSAVVAAVSLTSVAPSTCCFSVWGCSSAQVTIRFHFSASSPTTVFAFSPSPAVDDFIVNTNFGFASSFFTGAASDSGCGVFSASSFFCFSKAFNRASSSSFTNDSCFVL